MDTDNQIPFNESEQVIADIQSIVEFFIRLFKIQLNLNLQNKSEYRHIETQSFGSKYIFEISVENDDKVETRRMSVGPLGEGSGSKSKCYYVIYDTHIVVKIPPVPPANLLKYIRSIDDDRVISNQAEPKECIVPGVAVILKRTHPLPGNDEFTPLQLDARYLKLLQLQPDLQENLKINDKFVFFMDLSRHMMFSDVLSELYKGNQKEILDEIKRHFRYIYEFEGQMNPGNEALFYDIKNVFIEYEPAMRDVLSRQRVSPSLYKLQEWFAVHIAGRNIGYDEKDLSDESIKALNDLLAEAVSGSIDLINRYRRTVVGEIRKKTLQLNRPLMKGIVTNIMELIAWLNEKHIAMRDLKPDNVLVVGNRENYPTFLKFPDQFTLGLIDVETAVVIEGEEKYIKQPQIGGTPFYATPSHLMKNSHIKTVFGDLKRILYLQDWYAAVVMIYFTITGERLFIQTAKRFPTMRKFFKAAGKQAQMIEAVVKKNSQAFWKTAVLEFKTKVEKKEKLLASIEVDLPANGLALLKNECEQELNRLSQNITRYVTSQTMFKGEKNFDQLIQSDSAQIGKLKKKWESEKGTPKINTTDRKKVTKMLHNLLKLKMQQEYTQAILNILRKKPLVLTADILLKILFNCIFQSMYKNEWGPFMDAQSAINIINENDMFWGVTLF